MHHKLINASIQIVPIVQDRHPYEWVDEAIAIIRQSGIRYEVGPFATILEGDYAAVMQVIHAVHEHLYERKCAEWISNIQIQIRSEAAIGWEEKTEKFKTQPWLLSPPTR
ncbi:MAG TPA: thiamine-binding protein [Puia sp.]|nr:thiamine-binding protein [Puia sp.]